MQYARSNPSQVFGQARQSFKPSPLDPFPSRFPVDAWKLPTCYGLATGKPRETGVFHFCLIWTPRPIYEMTTHSGRAANSVTEPLRCIISFCYRVWNCKSIKYCTRSPAIAEKALHCLNSCAACWRWLLRTWKFWRFAFSHYVVTVFAKWHQRLQFKRWEFGGIESV